MDNIDEIFRPSSYNIIVPLKHDPGKYIMIHGYTGAIDIANKNIVDLLQGEKVSTPRRERYCRCSTLGRTFTDDINETDDQYV